MFVCKAREKERKKERKRTPSGVMDPTVRTGKHGHREGSLFPALGVPQLGATTQQESRAHHNVSNRATVSPTPLHAWRLGSTLHLQSKHCRRSLCSWGDHHTPPRTPTYTAHRQPQAGFCLAGCALIGGTPIQAAQHASTVRFPANKSATPTCTSRPRTPIQRSAHRVTLFMPGP